MYWNLLLLLGSFGLSRFSETWYCHGWQIQHYGMNRFEPGIFMGLALRCMALPLTMRLKVPSSRDQQWQRDTASTVAARGES